MAISLSDKLKIMKILSTEEGREKFKETLIFKMKSQKAQQATALCIAQGIAHLQCVTSVEISSGGSAFLPLKVSAVSNGEKYEVSIVQPVDAEFDYASLCEEFNTLVADNDAEKEEFLTKTAKFLEEKIAEKGFGGKFSVKII